MTVVVAIFEINPVYWVHEIIFFAFNKTFENNQSAVCAVNFRNFFIIKIQVALTSRGFYTSILTIFS